MTPQWFGIIISGVLGLAGLTYAITRNRKIDTKELQKEFKGAIDDLTGRVVKLETKIEIFWKGVSYAAADVLHSPSDHLGIDSLIDKFKRGTLRDEQEIATFKRVLENIAENDPDPFRQKAAREVLIGVQLQFEIMPGTAFKKT